MKLLKNKSVQGKVDGTDVVISVDENGKVNVNTK